MFFCSLLSAPHLELVVFLVLLVILPMPSRNETSAANVVVVLLLLAVNAVQVDVVQLSVATPALV